MSDALKAVLDRAMHDEAFLRAFRANPEEAIAEYDLTDAEREALVERDERGVSKLLSSPGAAGYIMLQSHSAVQ